MQRFKMLARDNNSLFTQYRTWVVSDQPDYDGYYYSGLKSGPEPFVNVNAYYTDNDADVMDFNLPNPLSWDTTRLTLPDGYYNSQLAVVDGYVYLFGGEGSDKILRATLDNPGTWEDTGATLPVALSSSQIAVIDGYIYLFGGIVNGVATDAIFIAPVSNPLSWYTSGSTLPSPVAKAQLAILDGYVYLLGGIDENGNAANYIYYCYTSDLETWFNTFFVLPNALYNSHVAVINSYLYLFGGMLAGGISTANIYKRTISFNDDSWSHVANMPFPVFNGQFFTVANTGYLIAPSDSSISFTRIFSCNLASPTSWVDTQQRVPGIVESGQFAIIYDRLFLFGGNGSSVIFADQPIIKYNFDNAVAVTYGNVTRTQYNSISFNNLFALLGFPPWKTNYGV